MTSSSDPLAANPTRELAAIMFSDIVGYTALMGRDEREGLRAVHEHRAHLRAVLPQFNGRLIGEIGDGTLSSFHSAVDAVHCARELQATLVEDPELRLRIGIHVGDVVFTDKTVLGDGVNIASRIHELAPPGGCCISERVYEEIRNKPEIQVKDLGEQHLKNVARPIRAYALTALDGAAEARSSPALATRAGKSMPKRRAPVLGASAILVVVLIAAMSTWKWMGPGSGWRPGAGSQGVRSIAVLPLENLSGDPAQEYFADGMTDELITDLAKISGLRVISRTSVMKFKGEHREQLPEIAKALGVNTIVEGSVLRVGDKVRITAQLIDASSDKHLWADSYERDTRDVLTLQDEVAATIAHEVDVELTPEEQARFGNSRTVNPAAHDAYLKGRYYLNSPSEERVRKALEQFDQAIKADPDFAPAYAGIADAYTWGDDWYFPANEVMPKAKAAAEKAVQLDDSLAESHTALAAVEVEYDFDWAGSEREYRRAIELNPNYAYGHDQYGLLLEWEGRFDESLTEFKRAIELDPLSPEILIDMAQPLIWQTQYAAAKEAERKSLELDPSDYLAQWGLGWVEFQAGNSAAAIPELEKARAMDSPPFVAGYLGYAYAKSGERAKAEAIIAELNQMASRRYVSPFCTALVYLGLGDKERALDGLEKAYDARSQWLTFLKVDKIYDPIRSEPRFIELLKKVGLGK